MLTWTRCWRVGFFNDGKITRFSSRFDRVHDPNLKWSQFHFSSAIKVKESSPFSKSNPIAMDQANFPRVYSSSPRQMSCQTIVSMFWLQPPSICESVWRFGPRGDQSLTRCSSQRPEFGVHFLFVMSNFTSFRMSYLLWDMDCFQTRMSKS